MNKDPLIFLQHIMESIARIESFSKDITKEGLSKNELKQYAIVRAIEIIGEAVKNLPKEFVEKYTSVPWRDIVGMRDKIMHQYFDMDLDIVWQVIKFNLPELKTELQKILDELQK